jgi:Mrp family chromosome partitioning ATPase
MTLDLVKGREIFTAPLASLRVNPAKVWESLSALQLSVEKLQGNNLFPLPSNQPAALAVDQLRSKILHGLATKGWKRIAVTSPTHGCGKSFVATNLALSLARRPASRTALIDLDLRRPQLAGLLGLTDLPEFADFLTGDQPLESVFRRFGRTLALGLNGAPVEMAAEMLHSPETAVALSALVEQLDPEVVVYDMPPALGTDDVLAMAPSLDAVLLVADGTKTTAEDLRACERLFEGRIPLMGVVLNRAQDRAAQRRGYGKA